MLQSLNPVPPTLAPASDAPAVIDPKALHPNAAFVRILGVNYVHIRLDDDGDLYLTRHAVPFARQLMPENWYHEPWLSQNRKRLEGTGTVYRLPTRPIDARVRSLDLVVKWSRVGQDVPLNTFTLSQNINAEFNSPFEEFSLLYELRLSQVPSRRRIPTQKPLAIYVPPERLQLWQTGRSRDKILARIARHASVHIDMLRSYILIYQWIDGPNAVDAIRACSASAAHETRELRDLTERVAADLGGHGFMVADHKPAHVIVRMRNGQLRRRKRQDNAVVYAVVDYELLARTKAHEDEVRASLRREYIRRLRDRFLPRDRFTYPPGRRPCRILDVDYVHGPCPSTGGTLWVVGNDPELVSYFLPERWHTRQVRLSDTGQTFYSHTKDRIHVVWRVSRVGDFAPGDMADTYVRRRLAHGYNSPFEEFAIALELGRRGVPTVHPRAIYVTASSANGASMDFDLRRFDAMRDVRSPDGLPVLPPGHDYVTIWGYWRGIDDLEALREGHVWTPVDAAQALSSGLIDQPTLDAVLAHHRDRLAAAGFVDLNPRPDHLLLSYIPAGPFKLAPSGLPESRLCNFEFLAPSPFA